MLGRLKKERTKLNPRQQRVVAALLNEVGPATVVVTVHDGTLMKDYTETAYKVWSASRKATGRMAMSRSGAVLRCNISVDGINAVNRRPLLPKMVDAFFAGETPAPKAPGAVRHKARSPMALEKDPYGNYGDGVIVGTPDAVVGDFIKVSGVWYNVHRANYVNLHAFGIRWVAGAGEAAELETKLAAR